MDVMTLFLIFGIGLACYAVIVSFLGLRVKSFPSRNAMVGLLVLGAILVGGTAVFGVELQSHEQEEREEGEKPVGEEASLTPLQIPGDLRV